MKRALIAGILLLALLIVCLFSGLRLEQTALQLIRSITAVQADAGRCSYTDAAIRLSRVRQKWEQVRPFFGLMLHQELLEPIDVLFLRTALTLQEGKGTESRLLLSELRWNLELLSESERPILSNLL